MLDIAEGSMAAAVLDGSVAFVLLAWLNMVQRRKPQAQCKCRLAVLDEMHAQLVIENSADRP